MPLTSPEGEIIGTKIHYVISADAGGNIPQTIQNMVGPGQGLTVVKNLYAFIKKREDDKKAENYFASIVDLPSVFNQIAAQYNPKKE